MKTKFSIALIVALLVGLITATIVMAATPTSVLETVETQSVSSPNLAIQCKYTEWTVHGLNNWGMKVYTYWMKIRWCYDGTKAWVTDKTSRGTVFMPWVSYNGDNITVMGNNTRYFIASGNARFSSTIGIPMPWGTLGWNQNVYPWISITGYYYGNSGVRGANH